MENVKNPNSPINLIRSEFGATLQEMKALTPQDRNELASAIARQRGMTEAECGFAFVAY